MHIAHDDLPLILLPGLNGNPRVLAAQREAFPNSKILGWIAPDTRETIAAYTKRLAANLDAQQPCIVAGVSFGGIVALEFARHVNARACVLIASTRDASGLPASMRAIRPVASLIPMSLVSRSIHHGWRVAETAMPTFRSRVHHLTNSEREFRQWAFEALLRWKPPADLPCDVFQIHGERDSTFAVRRSAATRVVPGAGHLLSMTHSADVNAFIREVIASTSAAANRLN
jgi:pimeloyl-ACP methyl ester carboxylesterase